MTAGLIALLVFAATPSAGKLAPPEKAKETRTLENAGPDEYLTAATALTLDRALDEAQRVIDKGRARFPQEQGFHLKQGDLHAVRGRVADAFYEYEWEVMRAGKNDTGAAAAKAIGALLRDGARGAEIDEIQKVLVAQAKLQVKGRGALEDLQKVQATRGERFALRFLVAEAQVAAGELGAAETGFRALTGEDRFFVPAFVELAGVLRLAGKTADADALDAKARAINPEHPSFTAPGATKPPAPAP